MKRYCFALDLVDDENLINEYEHWHKAENGWPEIKESIIGPGVINMEIYRTGNRLFMIMDTTDNFSLEGKAAADLVNPTVQKWEELMLKFQQRLPWASENEKWVMMKKIFNLKSDA